MINRLGKIQEKLYGGGGSPPLPVVRPRVRQYQYFSVDHMRTHVYRCDVQKFTVSGAGHGISKPLRVTSVLCRLAQIYHFQISN